VPDQINAQKATDARYINLHNFSLNNILRCLFQKGFSKSQKCLDIREIADQAN
jgi:hypothetical protein